MSTDINEDVVVFDVESDNLLDKITRVWVIAAISLCGKKTWIFTDQATGPYHCNGNLEDGVRFLASRKLAVCHNVGGYDYHVFEKFWPSIWNRKTVPLTRVWDTYVQSRCQHFDRRRNKGAKSAHGLENYGLKFGHPKPPIEDWSYWDADKLNRVLVDIEINRQAYLYLNEEAKRVGIDFTTQIRRTTAAQYWYTKQEEYGTYGNKELMQKYVDELDEEIQKLAEEIEPNLPKQVKVKAHKCTWADIRDKWDRFYRRVPPTQYGPDEKPIKSAYMPTLKVVLKNGMYDKHTAKWFDIPQERDADDPLIAGPYTKVWFEGSRLSQHAIVKEYLLSQGWKPTQWNYEKNPDGSFARDERGRQIKKSPKLTEDSFDSITGGIGARIALYNTLVHRRRTFKNEKNDTKGWINQLREDGRIASGAIAWNTGTGRAAQFGIVNVPSAAAAFGEPMRRVWEAPEGQILISVDMDSAQMRLLANFMGDDDYTRAVIEGEEFDADGKYIGTDAHTLNAIAFGTLDEDLVERVRKTQDKGLIKQCSSIRKTGKNGFYALLFGAGDDKLANTLKVPGGAKRGAAIKESFRTKLRKAGELQDRLKKQWLMNKHQNGGYIEVAGGTWVWCQSEHKLLNYLLMGSEGVLQNQAICWANNQMEKRRLNGHQLLSIHDELTFEFPLAEEEPGKQLLTEMYGTCSEKLGLDVLVTGTAQSGKNWLEIH